MRKLLNVAALGLTVLALVVGPAAISTRAADHLDAPLVRADGRIDINDVYVFQSPSDPANTVLAMTVNPVAGILSGTRLRPGALYEFLIDTNGDAVQDIAYRLKFTGGKEQKMHLKKAMGAQALHGNSGMMIAQGQVEETIPVDGGGRLFVGLRDDPFFFDLANFNNGATFCGAGLPVSDFFLGLNTTAIVLEVPTSAIGSGIVNVWARIVVDGAQIERMGKPALATVFIKPTGGANANAYNATAPSADVATWGAFFPDNPIPLLGGITVEQLLLPDVLIYNTAGPLVINGIPFDGYPNGRRLPDDVIDTSLLVLSNAGVVPVTTDCIDNDSTFLSTFPYLGVPN